MEIPEILCMSVLCKIQAISKYYTLYRYKTILIVKEHQVGKAKKLHITSYMFRALKNTITLKHSMLMLQDVCQCQWHLESI